MENVRSFADGLGAESSVEIDPRYTRIVVSKGHLETIVDAIISGERGYWPEDDETKIIPPEQPGETNAQDTPGSEGAES